MTNKDAADMARAKLQCIINTQSGVCDEMCDDCGLLYMQGNMDEHKEWLNRAIKALEQEPIFNKIINDIADLAYDDPSEDYEYGFNFALMQVVQIIGKYKEDKPE